MHFFIIAVIILLILCIITTVSLCRISRNWRDADHDYELDDTNAQEDHDTFPH